MRRTVSELQDRLWRTEAQLAAADSGHSSASGNVKSNDKIEKALEEMVALATQKYMDLERENRRLSAQVIELQIHMRARVQSGSHDASQAPSALQNGCSGKTGLQAGSMSGTDGAHSQHIGATQPHSVAVQARELGNRVTARGPKALHTQSMRRYACMICPSISGAKRRRLQNRGVMVPTLCGTLCRLEKRRRNHLRTAMDAQRTEPHASS